MEAVHVATTVKSGAALAHGIQMMNKFKELLMKCVQHRYWRKSTKYHLQKIKLSFKKVKH